MSRINIKRLLRHAGVLLALLPAHAFAQAGSHSDRQSLSDAWWTGPIAAAGAGTLPPGHILFEPYFYDVRSTSGSSFGSNSYLVYGLADRVSVGFIPVIGYNRPGKGASGGPSSSRVGIGDLSVLAQYRLTQFREGSRVPTISALVEETFPTGKYDQLGDRPSDGLGQGAYTTTLSIYSQTYFWMPSGRILRTRLDLSQAFSNEVAVRGVSVYGSGDEFRGRAKPGGSFFADASAEYSLTKRWVLALDINYGQRANTSVSGAELPESAGSQRVQPVAIESGWSDAVGFIPAVEYNWTPNVGAIFGVRRIMPGRNSTGSVTPVVAINMVR